MRSWLLWAVGGLVTGAIVHILIVLDEARSNPNMALSEIASAGPPERFFIHTSGNNGGMAPWQDSKIVGATCYFSIAGNPIEVTVRLPARYWSIELIDAAGQSQFSMNDRTGGDRDIRLVIGSRLHLSRTAQVRLAEGEGRIRLETELVDAIVRINAFVPDESQRKHVEATLLSGKCGPRAETG